MSLSANAGNGIVDLTALVNYANQPIPAYITEDNTTGNPITDKGATLGRVLFYDKRLSRNDTIACASCHSQARAFSDTATASSGVNGTTGRHSMRLINARFATEVRFFWDERAANLEAQTTQPIQDHVEMGFSGTLGDPGFPDLVTKLTAIAEYRVLFAVTFGDPAITEARVQSALAQFVRSIQSFDSRFDVGRAQVANGNNPFPNFTAQENAGKQLFIAAPAQGGAGCAICHRPPEFDIDPASLNNGVITKIGGGTDLTNTRSPSLRDLLGVGGQPNGAFMHDGSKVTLAQVIDHYNVIPASNTLPANLPSLDNRLRRPGNQVQNLNLTQQQKNDLAAFLATLTGTAVYTDEKWSDPFNALGQLSLIILPAGEVSIQNNGNGTATVSCQAVAGLQYELRASPNLANWTTIATVAANASGVCSQLVNVSGTQFFRYTYVPPTP
ncbi:MAG: cytochrome c peroxidase [Chthoniobacteraceae bacterium]